MSVAPGGGLVLSQAAQGHPDLASQSPCSVGWFARFCARSDIFVPGMLRLEVVSDGHNHELHGLFARIVCVFSDSPHEANKAPVPRRVRRPCPGPR